MGRGKRSDGSRSPLLHLSDDERAVTVLPPNLKRSLRAPTRRVSRVNRVKPPVVAEDGVVSEEGLSALRALQSQMDRQVAANDWNRSRVPNGMLVPPAGWSDSKYRKTLTPLRRAGLVQTRNGMWWVLPEGRALLGPTAQAV